MVEDRTVSAEQVKQVTERALQIENYMLRRAWGLCYLVLAVEIALITLLPLVFSSVGLPADYTLAVRLAVNTTISSIGLAVISWIFRKVYNAMKVRREITDSIWGKRGRPRWAAAILLLYYIPILAAIVFFRPIGSIVLYILLAAASPSFYYALKVTFPDRIPREGIAVLITYTACAVTNLVLFLSNAHYAAYPLTWAAMIIVSAVASVVAYTKKPPHPPEEPS
jgi:hypothetical protein